MAVPGAKSVARAFAAALLIYAAVFAGFALTFGLDSKSPQAIALGAILILGVAYLLAQGLAETAPRALTRRTAIARPPKVAAASNEMVIIRNKKGIIVANVTASGTEQKYAGSKNLCGALVRNAINSVIA